MTMRLAELEGMIRRGGVEITPAEDQGVEEYTLPADDGGEDERFLVTLTNQRKVTGTIKIYNTRTGEPQEVDINASRRELNKLHVDASYPEWIGKPQYTLDARSVPKPAPMLYMCPLNPKHDDWPVYQAVGAQPCRRRGGLPHELAVESHVRVKHPLTWANLQRKRARELEEEERAYRRWQMSQTPGFNSGAATTASAEAVAADAPKRVAATVTKPCPECDTPVSGNGNFGQIAAQKQHAKDFHAAVEATA